MIWNINGGKRAQNNNQSNLIILHKPVARNIIELRNQNNWIHWTNNHVHNCTVWRKTQGNINQGNSCQYHPEYWCRLRFSLLVQDWMIWQKLKYSEGWPPWWLPWRMMNVQVSWHKQKSFPSPIFSYMVRFLHEVATVQVIISVPCRSLHVGRNTLLLLLSYHI